MSSGTEQRGSLVLVDILRLLVVALFSAPNSLLKKNLSLYRLINVNGLTFDCFPVCDEPTFTATV